MRPEFSTHGGEKLIADIGKAFPTQPIPEGAALLGEDPSTISHPEDKWIFESFNGRAWSEMSLEAINPHWNSIWVFSPDAFRYYLPAYLAQSLRSDEGSMLIHSIIRAISPLPSASVSR